MSRTGICISSGGGRDKINRPIFFSQENPGREKEIFVLISPAPSSSIFAPEFFAGTECTQNKKAAFSSSRSHAREIHALMRSRQDEKRKRVGIWKKRVWHFICTHCDRLSNCSNDMSELLAYACTAVWHASNALMKMSKKTTVGLTYKNENKGNEDRRRGTHALELITWHFMWLYMYQGFFLFARTVVGVTVPSST